MEGTDVQLEESSQEAEVETKDLSFKEALVAEMDKEPEAEVEAKPEVEAKDDGPIIAPADMNAAEKAIFEKADPELKNYLTRRAHENRAALSREFQKLREMGQGVERYIKAVEPHQDYLAKHKVDAVMALENAIAWDKAIKEDPTVAAKQWLEANGIDPYTLLDEDGPVQQNNSNAQTYTQDQINELVNSAVEEALGQRDAKAQALQSSERAQSVFKSFTEDKPLFANPGTAERVKAAMAPLLAHFDQHGMPPGVDEAGAFEMAYQDALKRDPELNNALSAYNQASVAEKAKQKAMEARQASSSISGGLAGANPSAKNLDFREAVKLRMNGVI